MSLHEISQDEAIRRYNEGESVIVIRRPVKGDRFVMYDMKELLGNCKFLVDDESEFSCIVKSNEFKSSDSKSISSKIETNSHGERFEDAESDIPGKSKGKIDIGKMKALIEARWSYAAIAEEFGVTCAAVSASAKKHGFDKLRKAILISEDLKGVNDVT